VRLAAKTGVEIDETGIVVTAVHEACPPDLLSRVHSTYVPARVARSGLRNVLNWMQFAICARVRGQHWLHACGAARENCTSMAPQMRLVQVYSGGVEREFQYVVMGIGRGCAKTGAGSSIIEAYINR
jgi:hypothetical protein